jgi:hypothetical protein
VFAQKPVDMRNVLGIAIAMIGSVPAITPLQCVRCASSALLTLHPAVLNASALPLLYAPADACMFASTPRCLCSPQSGVVHGSAPAGNSAARAAHDRLHGPRLRLQVKTPQFVRAHTKCVPCRLRAVEQSVERDDEKRKIARVGSVDSEDCSFG